MGYLKCEECNGTYELKEGESPEDFGTCECGGKLNYIEKLSEIKPEKKDVKTPIPTIKPKSDTPGGVPIPKKRKNYLHIGLVVVVFIVAVIGGYYAYGQYQDNKYYESYRLQEYNSDQSNDIINESTNVLSAYFDTISMTQINQQYSEIIAKLDENIKNIDEAIDYEEKAKNYQKDMLNSAKTDYQKKYAESLIKQNDLYIQQLELIKLDLKALKDLVSAAKNNDLNKITELNNQYTERQKQIESIDNEMTKLINQREEIRAVNPDFSARLDKEAETAKNATL